MSITYGSLTIGGTWATPNSTAMIPVSSASTEEVIGSVPLTQEADVDGVVAGARRAFEDPRGQSRWEPARRAAVP